MMLTHGKYILHWSVVISKIKFSLTLPYPVVYKVVLVLFVFFIQVVKIGLIAHYILYIVISITLTWKISVDLFIASE